MDVLILAGGSTPKELEERTGISARALLPFRGRPMVDWVIDAVAHLGPVVVVGGTNSSPYTVEGGVERSEAEGVSPSSPCLQGEVAAERSEDDGGGLEPNSSTRPPSPSLHSGTPPCKQGGESPESPSSGEGKAPDAQPSPSPREGGNAASTSSPLLRKGPSPGSQEKETHAEGVRFTSLGLSEAIPQESAAAASDPEGVAHQSLLRHAPAGKTFIESLGNGLAHITSESFLLVTADLPFLTKESIDDFVARCDTTKLFNYPIIPMDEARRRFPQFKRTALKIREGEFTGGNIALVNTALIRRSLPLMQQGYDNRKSPLKLARIVGLGTLFRLILGKVLPGTLPIPALEKAVGKVLQGPVKAIITPYAEIGTDIDSPEQFAELEKLT